MGFFSDLKEDLSQAVNELMPEDEIMTEEIKAEDYEEEDEHDITEADNYIIEY